MSKSRRRDKQDESTVVDIAGAFSANAGGAQISRWDSKRFGPLLFSPKNAEYGVGNSPHGGIPICFPWFGQPPHQRETDSGEVAWLGANSGDYLHGWARLAKWKKIHDKAEEKSWSVAYRLTERDVTKLVGRVAPFQATFYANFTSTALELSLRVKNTGGRPFRFESLLHTYLRVNNVKNVEVLGLDGVHYTDKNEGFKSFTQKGPITFEDPVDRVYPTRLNPSVKDPSSDRIIKVITHGSATTVVWNPGKEGAQALSDLSKGEWKRFVCVESGNAWDEAITLMPGETSVMDVTYEVKRL